MNVFEFLGLSADHRAINKVVQLVKHFDDVNKKADEGVYHKKVKFPMYAQVKKDGVYAMVVKLPREPMRFGTAIFGRTGKMLRSTGRLVNKIESDDNIHSGVYIAELCSDDCSLEVLSGIVNPNRVNELDHAQTLIAGGMDLYYHDYLTLTEFINGHSPQTYHVRWCSLFHSLGTDANILGMDMVSDETELRRFADNMIKRGHEGAVFKQDVEWLAGAKDWHMMKIVRGVSYDLECIGYEEGTGKYEGLVANLLFRWKGGKKIKAMLGKGWTHQDAEIMFKAGECSRKLDTRAKLVSVMANLIINKNEPIGKIFEVYALQESSKGVLRLPKVGELRFDKCKPDF